jgi:hypothetical protein
LFEAKRKKDEMAKLELALLVGEESKAFLSELTKQLDRMEKLGDKTQPVVDEEADEAEETEEEAEADFTAKPAKKPRAKKAPKPDEDDEEEVEEADEAEETEEDDEPVPAKKAKAKKLTIDDCNDAAKALAASLGKKGVERVKALMEKHFQTQTLSELEESDYESFIALMKKG